ncbi:Glutathione peroxidase 1 [Toxocara canis]|uniref:Glutathione peroxidase n=1 Tax=Toxocara canis TaxID=6265 RepID=A0A0B2UR78_TOXCA|nr:Glutathione peroxidase 1 [Toxocara canis]
MGECFPLCSPTFNKLIVPSISTFQWSAMRATLMLLFALLVTCQMLLQVVAIDFSAPVYQFTVVDADGKKVSLEKYRGKVLLIVNVASQCGLTHSNYHHMKILHDKYKSQGFEIAAFPCNQFAGQEPDDEAHVKKFIKETFDFEPDLYAKINVNGAEEHALFTYLKHQQHGTIVDAIKWNFTKFLVDRHGRVVQRYAPTTSPADIEEDIKELLKDRSDL